MSPSPTTLVWSSRHPSRGKMFNQVIYHWKLMVFKEHQETFSPWWEGLKFKTGLPSEPSSNKGISPWVFGLGPNHMILISLNHTHAIWLTYIYTPIRLGNTGCKYKQMWAWNFEISLTFNFFLKFSSSLSRRLLSSENISIKTSCSLFASSSFLSASRIWIVGKQNN